MGDSRQNCAQEFPITHVNALLARGLTSLHPERGPAWCPLREDSVGSYRGDPDAFPTFRAVSGGRVPPSGELWGLAGRCSPWHAPAPGPRLSLLCQGFNSETNLSPSSFGDIGEVT